MKAVILIALVASVAARNLDLDTLRLIKEKSLLNRPVVDDLLLKEKLINQHHQYPLEKTLLDDVVEKVLPVEEQQTLTHGIRGIYDDVERVYTFEELTQTQLFQEYLRIPLFRRFIQYPSFQRFVASAYFQKFWQVPTYRNYFYNPVLFYKYIYPLVQLFHSEYTYPVNTIYGQDDTYTQDVYGLQGLEDVYRNKHVLPYVYNYGRNGLPTYNNRFAGQYFPSTYGTTKFLLDKIYKNLYANEHVVGDVTQVKTDVKILPAEKKIVVEPITGERKIVEEPKVVDVKVAERTVPVERVVETGYPVEKVFDDAITITERDVLLLKLLVKANYITPEIYESVIRGQVHLKTVLHQIFGETVQVEDVLDREVLLRKVLLKVLLKENIITPEIYQAVVRGHVDFHTVLRQIYGRPVEIYEIVKQIVNKRDYVDTIFNIPTVNRFDRFNRYDTLDQLYKYKYNTYYNTEYPTLRENTFDRLPIRNVLDKIVA